MSDDIPERLLNYLLQTYPERSEPQVVGLNRINEGWESDVYAFQMLYGPAGQRQAEDLILRIYPGNDAQPKSSHEYDSLSLLHKAGYPVPQVYRLDQSGKFFDKPFMIMEKIDGSPMWPMFGKVDVPTIRRLLEQFCRLYVDLHTLDWRPFVPNPREFEPEDPHGILDRQFAGWLTFVKNFSHSDFDPFLQWLMDHRSQVSTQPASIIHWDFHPNNILVRADGSAVVIDWTGTDITDARFDLAWTLLLLHSYEGPRMREFVLWEYQRQLGRQVENLEFFDVAACLRRLFSIFMSMSEGAEKLGMRPGAQAQMAQKEPILRVYNLLLERTGIQIPVVEKFLAS